MGNSKSISNINKPLKIRYSRSYQLRQENNDIGLRTISEPKIKAKRRSEEQPIDIKSVKFNIDID